MYNQIFQIDTELEEIIKKRVANSKAKLIVVGTGITSSHLGDERNLREFILANEVTNYIRSKGINVFFYLADDSIDPLDFRQLRIAANKDELLIKKFESYCGTPLHYIPDPYACHQNYSVHFQNGILERLHYLHIYPNILDTWSSYESGLYDEAIQNVFTHFDEFKTFLKKKFPTYTMKKIFSPICHKCHTMEGVELKEINKQFVIVNCKECNSNTKLEWKFLKGKFNWKIDAAIKWNIFKTDFEPYSKAYLDPDTGSFYIAKALSQQFFGGHVPEILHYGQVSMDKSLSHTLLTSFPAEVFRILFLTRRKKDISISTQKLIQIAKQFYLEKDVSYYDYVVTQLPYDILEQLNSHTHDPEKNVLLQQGRQFAKRLLKKEVHPQIPSSQMLSGINHENLKYIRKLLAWSVQHRTNGHTTLEEFTKKLQMFIKENNIKRIELYPILRTLFSQEEGVPLSRLLHFIPLTFIYACVTLIDEQLIKHPII